jgi:hypothetical protein
MKTHTHANQASTFTDERLQRAHAKLASALADAASQGTIDEPLSARLQAYAADGPNNPLYLPVKTEIAEGLAAAISYLNELHGKGQLETEVARTIVSFGLEDPKLLYAVVEQTKADINLINDRLEKAVRAGVLGEAEKTAILAKPFLNQQVDDATRAISAVKAAGKLAFE